MGKIELQFTAGKEAKSDRALVRAVEGGLPLVQRPYAAIAEQLGTTESDVIDRLGRLIASGDIKRFGVVVRHHELGYRANGMVVWDVPDDRVDELGRCIGQFSFVTLAYRRPRRLPDWPYNLFTMVHAQDRDAVEARVLEIVEHCGFDDVAHEILYSARRFKQRGARYAAASLSSKEENMLSGPSADIVRGSE